MSRFSFSYDYDTLNDVFNSLNRKGKIRKTYLSSEYLASTMEYREMKARLNELLRKKMSNRTDDEKQEIEFLRLDMNKKAKEQTSLLQKHLREVSSRILKKNFHFTLRVKDSIDANKPLYTIGDKAEEYFAMQVLCRNVKRLFGLSMSSRDEILAQLKMLLSEDKSRYYLIRTDIEHCFESIPHDKLFEYLEVASLLDVKSRSLLRGLIRKEFESKNTRRLVKANKTGIPRGCAISSLLAELYLSKIDEKIKYDLPGIIFMARYVDDLIIVIHPNMDDEHHWALDRYLSELSNIYSAQGLTIHTPQDETEKCYTYDSESNGSLIFNFLGYLISRTQGGKNKQLTFSFSGNKKEKIKGRLDKTFEKFNSLLDSTTYDIAAHYLFDALHVITCNINLFNAKRGVKVGIYYSNKLLDRVSDLEGLDKYLRHLCGKISLANKARVDQDRHEEIESSLNAHLLLVSFKEGFKVPHKRYKISKSRLRMIKQSWE